MSASAHLEGHTDVSLRQLLFDDTARVLELNANEVPHVGDVSRERLLQLLLWSDVALGAQIDGELVAFVIALGPGSAYDSPNYRWFDERYDDFLYIDRVVVVEQARGRGIARALYDAALTTRPAPLLTAEVNVEPTNPGSMAFHGRYGFSEVGRVEHAPGRSVAMLAHRTSRTRDED